MSQIAPLYLSVTGGHKEFARRHRNQCEDTAPLALSPEPAGPDIETFPPSRVLPFLYVGNARDAGDISLLRDLGVSKVLNVTLQPTGAEPNGIAYRQLPASDSGQQNIKQYFEEAFSFIGQLLFIRNVCSKILNIALGLKFKSRMPNKNLSEIIKLLHCYLD